MSSTSIIAKITEIYDRNIEFDQDFFKNETIRGIEHTVINTLYGYKDAIVNSLETGYTNAVVEGNNNIIKSMKKTEFGFRSFQNMRLRVLLRKKIHINKKDNIKDTICIQDAVA